MAKYCLAAFAVLLMVELISSQNETVPILKDVQKPDDMCQKLSNDPNATGSANPSKPCEVICLVGKTSTRKVFQRDEGAECSADTPPKVCVNKVCTEQVPSTDPKDKGYLCSQAGTPGDFKAVEKTPNAPSCTVRCVPDLSKVPKGKAFDMPAQIGTQCSIANVAGTCLGEKPCVRN